MQMAACTADHGICHRIAQAGSRTAACNHTLTNPHLSAERNLASMNSVPIKRNRGNSTGRSQNHPNMGCSKLATSGTKLAARAGGLGRRPSPTLCSLLAPKGVGLMEPLRDYGALPELSEADMLLWGGLLAVVAPEPAFQLRCAGNEVMLYEQLQSVSLGGTRQAPHGRSHARCWVPLSCMHPI